MDFLHRTHVNLRSCSGVNVSWRIVTEDPTPKASTWRESLHVVIAAEGSFAVLCGHEKERMAGYASHAVLTLHLLMTKKIHRLALMLCALCLTEMGWASNGHPQTDGDTIKTYDIDEIVITSSLVAFLTVSFEPNAAMLPAPAAPIAASFKNERLPIFVSLIVFLPISNNIRA